MNATPYCETPILGQRKENLRWRFVQSVSHTTGREVFIVEQTSRCGSWCIDFSEILIYHLSGSQIISSIFDRIEFDFERQSIARFWLPIICQASLQGHSQLIPADETIFSTFLGADCCFSSVYPIQHLSIVPVEILSFNTIFQCKVA